MILDGVKIQMEAKMIKENMDSLFGRLRHIFSRLFIYDNELDQIIM